MDTKSADGRTFLITCGATGYTIRRREDKDGLRDDVMWWAFTTKAEAIAFIRKNLDGKDG